MINNIKLGTRRFEVVTVVKMSVLFIWDERLVNLRVHTGV
jgi:hypothetical protein